MYIREFFQPGRTVFSIELFPPKTPKGLENLKQRLLNMRAFAPDYISVTYGAGGGNRNNTVELCNYIKQELHIEAVAHLTCVAHSRADIRGMLADLKARNICNIMALRGDPPQGEEIFTPPQGGFRYAMELVQAIREEDGFGIGVAGYPEGHVEAGGYKASLTYQIEKVRAGGDVLVSQFFMDNGHFLRWRDDLRRAGITVPIEAGIMPALSAEQVSGFAGKCGVSVPPALLADLEKCGEDKAASAARGLEFALRQIEELLKEGVDGIHLYALNRLEPIRAVAPLLRGAAAINM